MKVNDAQNDLNARTEEVRHTPAWTFRRTVGPAYDLFDSDENEIATIESRTHAAMIVRAVNAHDALVAVRDAARNVVDCYVGPFDAEIDALRTALALAEGIAAESSAAR